MQVYKDTSDIITLKLTNDNDQSIVMELGAYELVAIEEYVDDITDELAEELEA